MSIWDFDSRGWDAVEDEGDEGATAALPAPGKRTLTANLRRPNASHSPDLRSQGDARVAAPVQRRALPNQDIPSPRQLSYEIGGASDPFALHLISIVQAKAAGALDPELVQAHASRGVAGPGGSLPHLAAIQAAFGPHDVSGVRAHVGGEAREAASAIGAAAYATGSDVAFAAPPDLHTAAHEAAHVVQQRAGVSLKGGVGQAGDPYEQHADAVADLVVRGESAEALLDQVGGRGAGAVAVQRRPTGSAAAAETAQTPRRSPRIAGFPAGAVLAERARRRRGKGAEDAQGDPR